MSIILGLSYAHHDGAACVVKNGKILAAIETERITKRKKDAIAFKETIDYVLDASNITWDEIDYVGMSGSPHSLFGNDVKSNFVKFDEYEKPVQIWEIPHQLSHSASAYYTSSFEKAVCLSVDASCGNPGEYFHNSSICLAEGNKINCIENPQEPCGVFYNRVVSFLGIGNPLYKAGTMMGLASYGNPIPDSNFDFHHDESTNLIESNFSHAVNIAATAQKTLEGRTFNQVSNLPNFAENLCLSGGTFLNCNANSNILNHSQFKNVHHFPGCGDSGIGIGAALYVAHHILDEPRYYHKPHEICYLGKKYETLPIDYDYIAKRISEGAIVAWMNGRSEFGPRALGNRSLLADPRNQHNRDRLNHIIKQREWYRPFAPITLEENYKDWFDLKVPSHHMLYVANVKNPKEIPAVTHVDGTARFQTITKESNPDIYNLIKSFEKITGIPILINTSLNGKSQPILETPEDGLQFFENTPVDMILIHGKIIEK